MGAGHAHGHGDADDLLELPSNLHVGLHVGAGVIFALLVLSAVFLRVGTSDLPGGGDLGFLSS